MKKASIFSSERVGTIFSSTAPQEVVPKEVQKYHNFVLKSFSKKTTYTDAIPAAGMPTDKISDDRLKSDDILKILELNEDDTLAASDLEAANQLNEEFAELMGDNPV